MSDASKRVEPRVPILIPVKIRVSSSASMDVGHILDLSSYGAKIRASKVLPVGTEVEIFFDLPSARLLGQKKLTGEFLTSFKDIQNDEARVRWSRPDESCYGIEFSSVDVIKRARFTEMIDALFPLMRDEKAAA